MRLPLQNQNTLTSLLTLSDTILSLSNVFLPNGGLGTTGVDGFSFFKYINRVFCDELIKYLRSGGCDRYFTQMECSKIDVEETSPNGNDGVLIPILSDIPDDEMNKKNIKSTGCKKSYVFRKRKKKRKKKKKKKKIPNDIKMVIPKKRPVIEPAITYPEDRKKIEENRSDRRVLTETFKPNISKKSKTETKSLENEKIKRRIEKLIGEAFYSTQEENSRSNLEEIESSPLHDFPSLPFSFVDVAVSTSKNESIDPFTDPEPIKKRKKTHLFRHRKKKKRKTTTSRHRHKKSRQKKPKKLSISKSKLEMTHIPRPRNTTIKKKKRKRRKKRKKKFRYSKLYTCLTSSFKSRTKRNSYINNDSRGKNNQISFLADHHINTFGKQQLFDLKRKIIASKRLKYQKRIQKRMKRPKKIQVYCHDDIMYYKLRKNFFDHSPVFKSRSQRNIYQDLSFEGKVDVGKYYKDGKYHNLSCFNPKKRGIRSPFKSKVKRFHEKREDFRSKRKEEEEEDNKDEDYVKSRWAWRYTPKGYKKRMKKKKKKSKEDEEISRLMKKLLWKDYKVDGRKLFYGQEIGTISSSIHRQQQQKQNKKESKNCSSSVFRSTSPQRKEFVKKTGTDGTSLGPGSYFRSHSVPPRPSSSVSSLGGRGGREKKKKKEGERERERERKSKLTILKKKRKKRKRRKRRNREFIFKNYNPKKKLKKKKKKKKKRKMRRSKSVPVFRSFRN